MPIADPEESRRYQREWARRRRELELAGELDPRKKNNRRKPRPIRIPKSLRGAHPIVQQARENHKARQRYLAKRSTQSSWKQTDKQRAKDEAARLASRPHIEAPQLDVSEAMLPRALLLLHAVLKEAGKPHRKIELVLGDVEPAEPEDVSGPDLHLLVNGERISIAIREESRGSWEAVEDDDDDWYPWERERKQVVRRHSGVLSIWADTTRHRDTNTWRVEDRLGYLFREISEREQNRKRAEQRRRREQRAQQQREREAERERKRLEPMRRAEAEARAEAERAQQAENERRAAEAAKLKAELAARDRRDEAFLTAARRVEHGNHLLRLVAVLSQRDDAAAAAWAGFAQRRMEQEHPFLPDPVAPPAPEPPEDDPEQLHVEPPTPYPEFDAQKSPPMPEGLNGYAPVLRKMRANADAKRRIDRFEERNSWMQRNNWDWYRRERRKLGPPVVHRDVPDLGVRPGQARLALLALHATIRASVSQGFRLGDSLHYANRLSLEWKDRSVEVWVSQEEYGPRRDLVTLHVGEASYPLASIDDLRSRYDDIARRAFKELADGSRVDHERRSAAVQEAAQRRSDSFVQHFRDLERYRREVVDELAQRVATADLAQQAITYASEHDDVANEILVDGNDWLARHDLGQEELALPDFTPSVVPAPPQPVEEPVAWSPAPRRELDNFWRKPWYAKRR